MRLPVKVRLTFRFSFKIELFFPGNSFNLRHLPTELTSLPYIEGSKEPGETSYVGRCPISHLIALASQHGGPRTWRRNDRKRTPVRSGRWRCSRNQYVEFVLVFISGLLPWITSCIWSIVSSFQMPTGSEDDETCTTFVLHEEDHTLGNSLRFIIMKKYEKYFYAFWLEI